MTNTVAIVKWQTQRQSSNFQERLSLLHSNDPRFVNASADASKTFENHQDHPLRQWVIRATCVFSYLYYRISREITHRGIRRTKVLVMQLALLPLINVELLPERQSSVSTDIHRESNSWTRDVPFEFLHRCIKKHRLYELHEWTSWKCYTYIL